LEKQVINTSHAPRPIGPYNQAIKVGNPDGSAPFMLFISGQICIDPTSGELRNKDVQEETHQVMHNLKAILQQAGMDFSNVVKTTIFLTDMNRFSEMNEVYGKYFDENLPAGQGRLSGKRNCAGFSLAKICQC
jgi:2-iminobutanoate/2-iminopropanoate deaminase